MDSKLFKFGTVVLLSCFLQVTGARDSLNGTFTLHRYSSDFILPHMPDDQYFLVLYFDGHLTASQYLRIQGEGGGGSRFDSIVILSSDAHVRSCRVYVASNLTCNYTEVTDLLPETQECSKFVVVSLPREISPTRERRHPSYRPPPLHRDLSITTINYSFIDCSGLTTAGYMPDNTTEHQKWTTSHETTTIALQTQNAGGTDRINHEHGECSSNMIVIIVLATLLTVSTLIAMVALYRLKKLKTGNAGGRAKAEGRTSGRNFNRGSSMAVSSRSTGSTTDRSLYQNVSQSRNAAYENVVAPPVDENLYLSPMEIASYPV